MVSHVEVSHVAAATCYDQASTYAILAHLNGVAWSSVLAFMSHRRGRSCLLARNHPPPCLVLLAHGMSLDTLTMLVLALVVRLG